MNLGVWLLSIVGPLAWRVLASLGIGIVSFAGIQAAIDAGLQSAQAAWAGFGGAAAQLVALSGINSALAIVAAGITARVSLMIMKRLVVK